VQSTRQGGFVNTEMYVFGALAADHFGGPDVAFSSSALPTSRSWTTVRAARSEQRGENTTNRLFRGIGCGTEPEQHMGIAGKES
jgi:hypothetical protein